ncbi:hypothetical protein BDQ12DRAFT_671175 [Crucibulum laeve]|uniref:Uncharacterized protein n=1 Tax=Crucibulum laeve TaxID=68775 RepID=A0A5C3LK56_9AGAR|nr:hypothetical protein BDQ12DRAFT_671175 [Crucibulum laeve]
MPVLKAEVPPVPEPDSAVDAPPTESTAAGVVAESMPSDSMPTETTWMNPLQPNVSSSDPSASTSLVASSSTLPVTSTSTITVKESSSTNTSTTTHNQTAHYTALQNAAGAAGINPELAYLAPTLAPFLPSSLVSTGPGGLPSFQAKFNAQTGVFTCVDAHDPSHLSKFKHAKHMSKFCFNVEG